MECSAPNCPPRPSAALGRKLSRLRPWVQTGFLGVWLAPVGRWLHGIPGCVFHCYSCPLSSFACPVGVTANYAALLPAVWEVPYLLIGLLLFVGAASGSLVCGWACPFGFLQDLLGKIFPRKISLPSWVGYFRYVVLVGLVILLPMILGAKGIPFDKQTISICRLCPAGALEAGLPYSVQSFMSGHGWMMSGLKTGILTRSSPPRFSFIVPGAGCFVRSADFWRCSTRSACFISATIPRNASSAISAAAAVQWA